MSFISRHTAPVDVFIRPLVHCALQQCELLAMATPVRKAFTGGAVGQMQRRRHHMTARGRQLSRSICDCTFVTVIGGLHAAVFTGRLPASEYDVRCSRQAGASSGWSSSRRVVVLCSARSTH